MEKEQVDEKQLMQQFPVKDTPFTIVKMNDQYFLTMGKYRLTEVLGSKEEAEEHAKDVSWDRLLQVMSIMIKEFRTEEETKPQLNKN